MEKLKLIYVYDAHCSWCFAFSKVIVDIQEKYKTKFAFEVLSGNLRCAPHFSYFQWRLKKVYGL